MTKKILVTGGAGFIGSHLIDKLINEKKSEVTVIDILEEQVHGNSRNPPNYLNKNVNFIYGSVLDYNLLVEQIKEHEIIYHLAAMVGVGQSMYQINKYIDNNINGTGMLLDILANEEHDVKKLIVASSNTIYGEGKYNCSNCGIIFPKLRSIEQLKKKIWEVKCPHCNNSLKPLLTDEESPLNPSSIYAFSKQAQEKMSLLIGDAYGINTTVLRFFLVYGPRQALSNPYTGVCAIFCANLFRNKPPIIFEDGLQLRDFVNVSDICQALILSMEKRNAEGEIFNVGSDNPISIKEIAEILIDKINPKIKPIYNNQYRVGDIRHCLADISKIKEKLGYKPKIDFKNGIDEVIEWVKPQIKNVQDKSQSAINELESRGLLK